MRVLRILVYDGSDEWVLYALRHSVVSKEHPYICDRGSVKEIYRNGIVELHMDGSKIEKKEKGLV